MHARFKYSSNPVTRMYILDNMHVDTLKYAGKLNNRHVHLKFIDLCPDIYLDSPPEAVPGFTCSIMMLHGCTVNMMAFYQFLPTPH